MPMSLRDRQAYRLDEKNNHTGMSDKERQRMFDTYLPKPNEMPSVQSSHKSKGQRRSRLRVRRFIQHQLHVFLFALIHGAFSLYIKVRQLWNVVAYQTSSILYYHHGTPQYIKKDVEALRKMPKHLSVILKAEDNRKANIDIERLIDEAAEIATWTVCAEIPTLSIYEKTGLLKKHMPRVCEAVAQKFTFYFGGYHPGLSLTSPHREGLFVAAGEGHTARLHLHLISEQDGRESMVDLTRTLAEMSQKGKLSPRDVSMELIDAELSEGILSEPDLLISFTPYIQLSGYPPWQIRLTEIFCLQDNEVVGYQVFLKALRNYSKAQFRRGK